MRGGAKYSDAACNLIQSIYNDTGDIQYVNVRNNGTILDLPADSAVEVACRITADGPKPLATGELKTSDQRLCTHDQSIRAYDNRSGRKRRQKSCCCRHELKSTLPER